MAPSHDPGLETDGRFPSGRWKGYFLHRSVSAEEWQMDLHLTFSNGRLRGNGVDSIGTFSVDGRYDRDEGKIWWNKRYETHEIFYKGYAEEQGIWGIWEFRSLGRDGFRIWPVSPGDDAESVEEHETPTAITTADELLSESETSVSQFPEA